MERIHGETAMHAAQGQIESHMTMNTGGSEPENPAFDDRLPEFVDRAGGAIGQTFDTIGERARDAAEFLDEHTGVITLVRRNPLAAVSVAFATGIVIAAISRPAADRGWVVERARRQLRTALLSGLTALAARELRTIVGDGELVEFVQSLFDGGGEYESVADAEADFDDEDDYYEV